MRSKEEAHDYRYLPDPDLPPLVVTEEQIAKLRAELPELPRARRARFVRDHGVSDADARTLTDERDVADWFDAAARTGADGKKLANWIQGELFASLNRDGKRIADAPVKPAQLGALVKLIDDGTITGKLAKDVFARMLVTGDDPLAIVEREGLVQVTDARRDRGRRARRDRQKSEASRRLPRRQDADARVLRGTGDEGDRREGEPAGRERDPKKDLDLEARLNTLRLPFSQESSDVRSDQDGRQTVSR